MDVPPALVRLLRRQHNLLTRRQALGIVSSKAIEHALRSGRWRTVHRAIYAAQAGPLTPDQHCWLGYLAAGGDWCERVALGGLSALCAWGLRGVEPNGIHILIPVHRRVQPPPGVRILRTRTPPEVATHLLPPTTWPGRSVVKAAAWARTDREARLIVAASFQQSLVTMADVRRAADELPTARRRRLVLELAEDCAGGSHSLGELDLLSLCRRHRLPPPSRQVARRDRTGQTRYVDALWDEWRVAVEIDGAHHLNVAQMWDDAVKANALELDGYVVLRYPAFALRSRGPLVAKEIREALHRAGWREPNRPL
jgi:very-short-patch-repair endonuclease